MVISLRLTNGIWLSVSYRRRLCHFLNIRFARCRWPKVRRCLAIAWNGAQVPNHHPGQTLNHCRPASPKLLTFGTKLSFLGRPSVSLYRDSNPTVAHAEPPLLRTFGPSHLWGPCIFGRPSPIVAPSVFGFGPASFHNMIARFRCKKLKALGKASPRRSPEPGVVLLDGDRSFIFFLWQVPHCS